MVASNRLDGDKDAGEVCLAAAGLRCTATGPTASTEETRLPSENSSSEETELDCATGNLTGNLLRAPFRKAIE